MPSTWKPRAGIAAAALTMALALAACGGAATGDSAAPPAAPAIPTEPMPAHPADPALTAAFPAGIQQSGTLRVGVSPNFAPLNFKRDDGTLTGAETELTEVLGQATGLRIEFVETNFAGLLSGLAADRFDIVISGVTDTRAREEQVNFVNFSTVGKNLLVRADDPRPIADLPDLCGRTMGVTIGTTYGDELAGISRDTCEAAGKPAIVVQTFDTGNDVRQAIATSRIDGTLGAVSANTYTERRSEGALVTAGPTVAPGVSGALVPKDDAELTEALRLSFQTLMDDGTVRSVLDRWGLGDEALQTAQVNGATF